MKLCQVTDEHAEVGDGIDKKKKKGTNKPKKVFFYR
jgi:hypothetical protein